MEDDFYTSLQFDNAVSYFGRYIESKIAELDDKGKRIHSLEELLEDTPNNKNLVNELISIFGVIKK